METAHLGLDTSVGIERRHIKPEVAGSSPALVNFSLFIPKTYTEREKVSLKRR